MGKHGPCYHCGVTSTPLWRNGPPEKPILCNACGSRWRTKGTLTNYTPLHSRSEPNDLVDHRVSKVKTISIKNKEAKVLKRKINYDIPEYGVVPLDYNNGLRKVFHEDTSNRSSSGSVVSNSESFAQYGSGDASDFTGPPQPIVWDSTVPSKKRTCVTRTKPSSVEKLTKDLYTIWHEQQSSCLSGSSEDDLLLETDQPMGSVEFGHGSVLIRHPISIARDEESEASSLSIDQKQNTFPSLVEDTDVKSSTIERIRRDNDELEKMQILAHHNSPLRYIDLQDVLNYEKFASNLTSDEQQQLLTYLPLFGTLRDPVSLKNMFSSIQFKDSMLSFQELLADGVFENSFSGDMKGKSRMDESEVMGGFKGLATYHRMGIKGSQDGQHPKFSGTTVIMKSPKRMIVKSSYDQRELMFSSQNDNSSIMLGSSHFDEESLLVDVPFNSSFPQAELLLAEPSTSSCSIYPNLFHP